jgi:hypothetical protein
MKNKRPSRKPGKATGKPSEVEAQKRSPIKVPISDEPEYSKLLREGDFVDPLSAVTRSERKNLLLVSFVSLAVTLGNLVPQEITALGIKVSPSEQRNLFLLLACAVLYLMGAFIFYGHAEFQRWQANLGTVLRLRRAAGEEIRKTLTEQNRRRPEATSGELFASDQMDSLMIAAQAADDLKQSDRFIGAARRRLWFEYSVPLLAGVCALILLLQDSTGVDFLRGPSDFAVAHPAVASLLLFLALLSGVLILGRKKFGPAKRRLRRLRDKWEHKSLMRLSAKYKKYPEGSKKHEEAKVKAREAFQTHIDKISMRAGRLPGRRPVSNTVDGSAEPSGSSGQAPPAR